MKENNQQPNQTLRDIKQLMERSSRFISLSGLSGIAAGICALIGAWFAAHMLHATPFRNNYNTVITRSEGDRLIILQLTGLAIIVFVAASLSAFYLTYQKARKNKLPIWDHTSRRLFINMIIPLAAGAVFIIGMLEYNEWRFVAPACLIFYGLALVNASKYTVGDIRYLGYCEIILGLINMYFIGYGLIFWAAGFGALHIFYGSLMWWKYDRN